MEKAASRMQAGLDEHAHPGGGVGGGKRGTRAIRKQNLIACRVCHRSVCSDGRDLRLDPDGCTKYGLLGQAKAEQEAEPRAGTQCLSGVFFFIYYLVYI